MKMMGNETTELMDESVYGTNSDLMPDDDTSSEDADTNEEGTDGDDRVEEKSDDDLDADESEEQQEVIDNEDDMREIRTDDDLDEPDPEDGDLAATTDYNEPTEQYSTDEDNE